MFLTGQCQIETHIALFVKLAKHHYAHIITKVHLACFHILTDTKKQRHMLAIAGNTLASITAL